jgi:MFS family permease
MLLTLATFAAAYARTALSPIQETMRTALALSDNQMALLQGPALALPMMLAAIPLGLLVDRYSRARLLLAFASLSAAGSVLTGVAPSFTLLFVARCLVGLAASATLTTGASLLADLYAPAQRGRAAIVVAIGQIAGTSAAFALGGVLLAMSGAVPRAWQPAMLWLSSPLVLVILLLLALREPARTGRTTEDVSVRTSLVGLWRHRAVIVPLLAGVIMVAIADCASLIWAAPALSRNFSLPPEQIGAIMATALLVSGVAGAILGGFLADHCQRTGGPRRTISALSGLALLSVPASFFATTLHVESASVMLVAFMTIGSIIGVSATTVATIVLPNELRGLCLSVMFAAGAIFGLGLAPITVSVLSGELGGPAMIGRSLSLVCAVTSILGTAAFAVGRRYLPSLPAASRRGSLQAPHSGTAVPSQPPGD